jgi:hypothetical protein
MLSVTPYILLICVESPLDLELINYREALSNPIPLSNLIHPALFSKEYCRKPYLEMAFELSDVKETYKNRVLKAKYLFSFSGMQRNLSFVQKTHAHLGRRHALSTFQRFLHDR